ncbi:serine/threonine protein kinase [Streptomyces sp. NPDC026673]|uniref:serine/threonine protein kinase n=1 Tax=Streptomyces sp. NPDC026673 TaxID=3155724 RepID=UPI0033C10AD4
MAERSTAAVGVANESGDNKQLTAHADSATADEATDQSDEQDAPQQTIPEETAPTDKQPPELHSGYKLAERYRLEECLTRADGFSSWRAVDEKLRRAVGIHILPADHGRARPVLAAARSAALLGDPRFVQVLDAVEENDLVYVIHEWLPDAKELTALITTDPLEPHEAYQMVSQISQAMAAAHREGLSHLRLGPDAVLRTEAGQYRIRGLAVAAALRGISSERPQREDTEAIGALLYAALTQRWPYPRDEHGLTGLPKDVGLVAPDQVRAGVHRGLSELTMRALVNDGATASREPEPCATPEELAKAVTAIPKIRPPEPAMAPYSRTTYQQGSYRQTAAGPAPAGPTATLQVPPPPALPGRTGKALKWSVSALLIVALGLGSWQLAETLMDHENQAKTNGTSTSQNTGGDGGSGDNGGAQQITLKPLPIQGAAEYAPYGGAQHPNDVRNTYDAKTSTYWRTNSFADGPEFAPSVKKGVGIAYDLGATKKLGQASIDLYYGGDHTTVTLYAADSLDSSAKPHQLRKLATVTTDGKAAKLSLKTPAETRYVVVWLTALPHSPADGYSGEGYKQAITNVRFEGQ